MYKVTGIDTLSEIVEANDRIEKAEREIKKMRIKEMIASGVEPKMAKIMVEAMISCGI